MAGKLSLYNEYEEKFEVGAIIQEYIGVKHTKELIDYTDKVYLKFGADSKLEGIEYKEVKKYIISKRK